MASICTFHTEASNLQPTTGSLMGRWNPLAQLSTGCMTARPDTTRVSKAGHEEHSPTVHQPRRAPRSTNSRKMQETRQTREIVQKVRPKIHPIAKAALLVSSRVLRALRAHPAFFDESGIGPRARIGSLKTIAYKGCLSPLT